MRLPKILCRACEVEIEQARAPDGTETGSCPECGLTEAMEVIEDELEEMLVAKAMQSQNRLDPDTPGSAAEPPAKGRFTVKL